MKKEKKGGKLIIAVGAIAICTVTAGAFFRKDIIYKYYEYSVNKNYSSTNVKVNDYYLEDNFEYVNNYTRKYYPGYEVRKSKNCLERQSSWISSECDACCNSCKIDL